MKTFEERAREIVTEFRGRFVNWENAQPMIDSITHALQEVHNERELTAHDRSFLRVSIERDKYRKAYERLKEACEPREDDKPWEFRESLQEALKEAEEMLK